ncbi:hypothetical protein PM082_001954 [Marasmius tenuissimus]|nr:hypothetical protein PM082_001954 [Marasmius tenuissimus]
MYKRFLTVLEWSRTDNSYRHHHLLLSLDRVKVDSYRVRTQRYTMKSLERFLDLFFQLASTRRANELSMMKDQNKTRRVPGQSPKSWFLEKSHIAIFDLGAS